LPSEFKLQFCKRKRERERERKKANWGKRDIWISQDMTGVETQPSHSGDSSASTGDDCDSGQSF
jgi:hypothetical protein